MGIYQLNHAVLCVQDATRAASFYRDVLDFEVILSTPDAAFLRAPDSHNDHDLGLFTVGTTATTPSSGRGAVGLYHLAWEVDTLSDLARISERLSERGALIGATDHGTTKSLYARDLDSLEFEIVWLIPSDRLNDTDRARQMKPLDLPAELRRFEPDTPSGHGISRHPPTSPISSNTLEREHTTGRASRRPRSENQ